MSRISARVSGMGFRVAGRSRIYFGFVGLVWFFASGCSTAKRLGEDVQVLGPVAVEPEDLGPSSVLPQSEPVLTLKRAVMDTLPRRVYEPDWGPRVERNLVAHARRRGHLTAEATCIPDTMWGRRIGLQCQVNAGELVRVGEVIWSADSTGLPIEAMKQQSLLAAGMPFDADLLESERSRLAQQARSLGFAGFDEAYISFVVDTAGAAAGQLVKLEVLAKPQVRTLSGKLVTRAHERSRFGTIRFTASGQDSLMSLKPEILSHLVSIEAGMVYNNRVLEDTYRRLAQLPSVRRVEIRLGEAGAQADSLPVEIQLGFRKKMALELELDMTRRDAAYGPLAEVTWQHLNPMKMGDKLSFAASGGISSVKPFAYDATSLVPNSGEWSVGLDYNRPGLFPLPLHWIRPSSEAQTLFGLDFRRESRPDYLRRNLSFVWGHKFVENPATRSEIQVDWLELTHTNIDNTAAFDEWLNIEASDFIRSRFADYSSVLTRLTWRRPAQRVSVEWAGQALRALSPSLALAADEEGRYLLGGVPFAQFFRLEGQQSWHWGGGRVTQAARLLGGAGWAGQNFESLPFDRSFFGGGVQGMRGWGARDLGPGGNVAGEDTGVVEGLGDVRLEGSWEVRWKWTDMWTMAGFVDLGNVWLHGEDAPDVATFRRGGRWSTIGWNAGAGLRVDFEFFLLRLDAGLRLHDPGMAAGARWIGQGPLRGALHLGLGHPF